MSISWGNELGRFERDTGGRETLNRALGTTAPQAYAQGEVFETSHFWAQPALFALILNRAQAHQTQSQGVFNGRRITPRVKFLAELSGVQVGALVPEVRVLGSEGVSLKECKRNYLFHLLLQGLRSF